MRKKLFWSILAACVTLVVTVTVTAEIVQQVSARNRVLDSLERQGTAVADRLEANASALIRGGTVVDGVVGFLEGVEASTDVRLRVGEVDGGRVSYLDGSAGVLDDETAGRLGADEVVRARYRSGSRAETLSVAVPLTFGPRLGVVVIEREIPRWSLSELVSTWRMPFLFAIVVSGVSAHLVSRGFTRRLRRLADAVDGYRIGRRTEVPVGGDDEVGAVAAAFNVMSDQLDEARRRENDFFMDISHDLRTPLTTIVGYSEMLEANDDPGTAAIGRSLHRESTRLGRLIGDLMLLGRLRASQFTARHDRIDLTGVVAAAVDGFRTTAEDKSVALTISGPPIEMYSDAARIGQIVGNLLDNALRHTPAGGSVVVTVARADGRADVVVADSGPGVPEERIDRLFDRLDAGPGRPAGSGLGLAIVRELAELLGGVVDAENLTPTGLRVAVSLPLPESSPGS